MPARAASVPKGVCGLCASSETSQQRWHRWLGCSWDQALCSRCQAATERSPHVLRVEPSCWPFARK